MDRYLGIVSLKTDSIPTLTLTDLHNRYLKHNKILTTDLGLFKITGEIKDCKIFTSGTGIKFDIVNEGKSFKCLAWKNNINIEEIVENQDKIVSIIGNLKSDERYRNPYINLTDNIIFKSEDSSLKKLKDECYNLGYFTNKKQINWENLNKLAIISKDNTQGFSDFIKQLKAPIEYELFEISLEGEKTEIDLINAIKTINMDPTIDCIIIIRGGGSTADISNSFDSLKIFDEIKNSKKPIITAIGHENDRDDKLLITNISDMNYSTPSSAVLAINKEIFKKIKLKINSYFFKLQEIFQSKIEQKKENEYLNFISYLEKYFIESLCKNMPNIDINKICYPIVDIDNNKEFLILNKNNLYYLIPIPKTEPISISNTSVEIQKQILNAVNYRDIKLIKSCLKKFKLTDNEQINNYIKSIEKTEKDIVKYDKILEKNCKLKINKSFHFKFKNDEELNILRESDLLLLIENLQYYILKIEEVEEYDDSTDYLKIFSELKDILLFSRIIV